MRRTFVVNSTLQTLVPVVNESESFVSQKRYNNVQEYNSSFCSVTPLSFTLDSIEMNAIHNSANTNNRFQDSMKSRQLCMKGKNIKEMITSGKILIQLLGITIV